MWEEDQLKPEIYIKLIQLSEGWLLFYTSMLMGLNYVLQEWAYCAICRDIHISHSIYNVSGEMIVLKLRVGHRSVVLSSEARLQDNCMLKNVWKINFMLVYKRVLQRLRI